MKVKDIDLNPYGPIGTIISLNPFVVKFGSWRVLYKKNEIEKYIRRSSK